MKREYKHNLEHYKRYDIDEVVIETSRGTRHLYGVSLKLESGIYECRIGVHFPTTMPTEVVDPFDDHYNEPCGVGRANNEMKAIEIAIEDAFRISDMYFGE